MRRLLKRIPWWGWFTGFFYFGLQYGMYRLADWISRLTGTINHAFPPKIPFVDDNIPVIAIFAIIYLFSYVFWICGPIAVSLTKKQNFVNYLVGLSAAYLVGFFIFIFMPTCMDRNAEGLMELAAAPGFGNHLLAMIYGADGSGMAFNLFPSYHCLISLYCYLGVRRQPEIHPGFRIYSLVMTILICMSTVFTKQHYFIDIIGGLSISILCYLIVRRVNPGKKYSN
ncbi:MAG: phosphatase PAP2 family protein [Oscillospiraceae bacterium]|nr:phosphatase PAP2 family protein [Oscillospiraceae bacterium]